MLLTDDGRLTERLTHPRYGHEKEYSVKLAGPISDQDLHRLSSGVTLDGRRTKPAKVRRQNERIFRIVLREGRNRQIRRMLEELGHEVKSLKRVRLASLRLGNLRPGQYRRLTADERHGLLADCDLEEI
jgi:23S rRNA pseudouridine2605 synthase/23S rRNA pseudouridine2604 synthase